MKKIIVLFVMAIFLVSILPLSVLADGENMGADVSVPSVAPSVDASIPSVPPQVSSELGARIAKKNMLAKERFLESRAEFAEKKKLYLEQRDEIRAKIADVKAFCEENLDSDRCSRMKKAFIEGDAKSYLLNALNTIEKVLEKRKAKIEELMAEAEVSAEVMAGLEARLNEINARLDKVAELRVQVEAATTKEEIKHLARLIRNEWKLIKGELGVSSGHILSNRFSFVIGRAASLQKKLEVTIDRLESKGYDVLVVEEDVQTFKAHINRARELVSQAKAEFASKTEGDVREGHKLLAEAQRELKLAHQMLKKILAGLKVSAGADAEAEIEAISEPQEPTEASTESEEIETEDGTSADVSASVDVEPEVDSSDVSLEVGVGANLEV